MKRKVCLILSLIILMAVFTGCASPSSSEKGSSAASEQTAPTQTTTVSQAAAPKFPTGPITMIAHFGAGGTNDVNGRMMAAALTKKLGQQVNVTNITGGSGEIGALELKKAKPDGYTIGVLGFVDTLFLGELKGTVTLDDFDCICQVSSTPYAIFAKPGSPFKTLKDVVEYAKANPKKVTISESSAAVKLWVLLWAKEAGIEVTTVNFPSGAENMNAMLGGHVELGMMNPSYIKNVRAGGGEILATGGDKLEEYPEVPTMKELGYGVVDAVASTPVIALPKGLPDEVRKVYVDAVAELANDKEFLKSIRDAGFLGDYVYGDEYAELYAKNKEICLKALRENIEMFK
jgi:tripartite-type tricarboxylate transporter receptor subunit TctC